MRLNTFRTGCRFSSTVVTVDKIPQLPAGARIFSLIQPTGKIHVGNYLGAIKNWKDIASKAPEGAKCIFGTADLHSLTSLPNAKELRANRNGAIASILASGLDPEKCILFHQSSIPEHAELNWILTCITSLGALNRMTQWKLKAHVDQKLSIFSELMGQTKAGLLLYPVLQAADILLYNATHVPVGDDQSQHLELCRGIGTTFNHTYGDFFTMPKTLLTPTKKIAALRDPRKKMSKSDKNQNSSIYMTDDADTISRKLQRAITDSVQGKITFDAENRPGVSNLVNIAAGITGRTIEETVEVVEQMDHKQLKDFVTELLVEEFKDKRVVYEQLMNDEGYLGEVCARGTERAREIALKNLAEVKKLTGLA